MYNILWALVFHEMQKIAFLIPSMVIIFDLMVVPDKYK